jgi:hypothetical protein
MNVLQKKEWAHEKDTWQSPFLLQKIFSSIVDTVKWFTEQERHWDKFLHTLHQLNSPVPLFYTFPSESPHDVKHPARVSIEAAIRGAERHIYSILMDTERHWDNDSLTHHYIFTLHVTIILSKVVWNNFNQSVKINCYTVWYQTH